CAPFITTVVGDWYFDVW
nr:immunoglobulin heavy chain junction region [Mus musculus]